MDLKVLFLKIYFLTFKWDYFLYICCLYYDATYIVNIFTQLSSSSFKSFILFDFVFFQQIQLQIQESGFTIINKTYSNWLLFQEDIVHI